jgi:hypothetical protein
MLPKILVIVCLVLICGCSVKKPQVDYRHFYDFSAVKAYAIYSHSASMQSEQLLTHVRRNRIEMAIEDAMDAKGFSLEGEQAADIWVSYHLVASARQLESYNKQLRACYRCKRLSYDSNQRHRPGTLIIDLVDPKTRMSVWRSSSKKVMEAKQSSTEKQEFIYAAVQQMLAQFPPGQPGKLG